MSRLELVDVAVQQGGRTLVHELSLEIGAGELVGLIGPNGAGKSTLIKAVAQLLPYRGSIRLHGESLDQIPARERARRLAYLSQDDRVQWPISVADLVALGRHPYRGGWWRGAGRASDADRQAIESAMRATDVWSLRARASDTLSGGERARVRLARALAVEAPLLLADEPVAALDPRHQLEVMGLLRAQAHQGASVIVVLHDLTLASRFCDRLLLLHQGRAVASGAVEAVLSAEHLRLAYGIGAVMGKHQGQSYIVPWSYTTYGDDG
ncbi:ABC transporter ATP-binding protein [Allochromatium vinosum]|uniref:ABC transporter related protein n=1 Tax=Allochromatium vinosum (strain ATCC 17899 / DSM 180 / NBRC 103801 / NCIMB 10441 / D) TaxID=572477 RepID=D3RU91_ALLVD|nr:ABC transporter ATP-binding protein [Allochromatium vinosum]ADC62750.1 ABC transporter related protein [Allochromatium vinosum DSM 180]